MIDERIIITRLNLLNFKHSLRNVSSTGHGAFLWFQNKANDNISIMPAIMKMWSLYVDRIVIHGKIDIKPAIVAPIPSVTSKAGKAQQIKVLRLVNKLRKGAKSCL